MYAAARTTDVAVFTYWHKTEHLRGENEFDFSADNHIRLVLLT